MEINITISPVYKSPGYGNKLTDNSVGDLTFETVKSSYHTDYDSDYVLLKINNQDIYLKKRDLNKALQILKD